jgi:hypothetical protein
MNEGLFTRRGHGGRLKRSVALLPLIVALTGCAGTPWGETLSGSFPPPREPNPEPTAPSPSPNASPPAVVSSPPVKAPSPPIPKAPQPAVRQTPGPPTTIQVRPPASPAGPAPYRVTIRLPQADPSAPAEAVTQALRAAGIPFEVETIEKMKAGISGPALPEPGSGPPVTPSVRPAPPPR